jgi:hypothetical protein
MRNSLLPSIRFKVRGALSWASFANPPALANLTLMSAFYRRGIHSLVSDTIRRKDQESVCSSSINRQASVVLPLLFPKNIHPKQIGRSREDFPYIAKACFVAQFVPS